MVQLRKDIEWRIISYWAISALIGLLFLRDWLLSWDVGETIARHPWLVVFMIAIWLITQGLYVMVAHPDGRPLIWRSILLFTLANGVFETWAFAFSYWLGEVIGTWATGWFLSPSAAATVGFIVGVVVFSVYSWWIHAFFWIRFLPSHTGESPRTRTLQRWHIIALTVLTLSWALCLWLNRDIWTVTILHILMDLVLMVRLRPSLFVPPPYAH
jgi:hypothetical protein